MSRRRVVLGLLGLVLLTASGCQMYMKPSPTLDEVLGQLPPHLMAVDRKEVGNSLLTGVLAYQALRPVVAGTCRDTTCATKLVQMDQELQTIFNLFWGSLFTWPVAGAPPKPEIDWGKLMRDLLALVLKLAMSAAVPMAAPGPGVAPPGVTPPWVTPPGALPSTPGGLMPVPKLAPSQGISPDLLREFNLDVKLQQPPSEDLARDLRYVRSYVRSLTALPGFQAARATER
jgi:hypothetical protein